MLDSQRKFDVAIIGSGIAGSILASILARHDKRVVVFEAKHHPRFAIGESMILETSEIMRGMAAMFDVPELAYFSSEHYLPYVGSSHGVKRHFGYLYHHQGREQEVGESLQAVIPRAPYGHELHLYRQDSDYYLMATAIAYGATVLQDTPVKDVVFSDDGAELVAVDGTSYFADYVVDAGGYRSVLADRFDLRHSDLQTHSRAIFTHMVNVPCFNDAAVQRGDYGLPFRMSEGTLHHLFEGGWFWIIPFGNHVHSTNSLCSVGLLLDPRQAPVDSDLTAEEEFWHHVGRFPAVKRQLGGARPVRAWTRTGRIQYGSRRVVGERFALLGHAAGFVDPLFSKGLYVSLVSTTLLAHHLLGALDDGDFSASRFASVEQSTQAYLQANDRLIANAYRSFADPNLWRRLSVLWLLGAYTEYVKLCAIRAEAHSAADYCARLEKLHLVGGGYEGFDELAEQIYELYESLDDGNDARKGDVVRVADGLLRATRWMPDSYLAVLDGKNHLAANKLRPGLLLGQKTFMGSGSFRSHFFGEHSLLQLVSYFVRDSLRYSATALRLQRRLRYGRR